MASGGITMWASGPPTFLTVWAWPTHFWHYFLLFLFCLSPLIINFFQDWPTHFQNRSATAECGSFLCSSDMLIAISFEIEFPLENMWFIGRSG